MAQGPVQALVVFRNSLTLSGLAHADEVAVVVAGQRPQKGADLGTVEEEANGVDAHRGLAVDRWVPDLLELLADLVAEVGGLLRLGERLDVGRDLLFGWVGQAVG